MTGMFAAGVRTPVQRFDAHLPHQRRHMTAAYGDARQSQEVTEHPRPSERVIEMQLVDPSHQR